MMRESSDRCFHSHGMGSNRCVENLRKEEEEDKFRSNQYLAIEINTMLRLILILALFGCASAANYAVLVAGSSGYSNYRHQADVCHAYQILHKNGIPDSNIVVMMYDDIAHNIE